jgi:DNA-binding LacI/PurR family transcriptional regulator
MVDAIRLRIKSAEYSVGTALPAEIGLAEKFEVSRATIRKAIEILVASGDLTREPHSRPIVARKQETPGSHEIPIWCSMPVAEGSVLSFLRGVSRGLMGTPFRMVVREPSRYTGTVVHADERQFLNDLLRTSDFAGAILYRDHFAENQDLVKLLGETGKPIVFVDALPPDDVRGDYVGTANILAARACVEHLFELGHSRIVFVADTDVPIPTKDRIQGYRRAMAGAGIENLGRVIVATQERSPRAQQRIAGPFARLTKPGGYFCDLAHRAVQKILAMDPLPSAIFACHDVFAASIWALLSGAGLRVPEEISLVGFDWLADCERDFPDNLTTAAQSFEGFGLHASSLILDRISGEATRASRHVLLDAPLTVRSSTAPNLIVPAFEPAQRLGNAVTT